MKIYKVRDSIDKITPREELFVKEFLKDLNATQAVARMGRNGKPYKNLKVCNSTARDFLEKQRVRDALQKEFAERMKKIEVDVEFVLRELMQIASCDIGEAFKADGTLKDIHDIPTPVRKCIAGFENEELYAGRGEERTWIGQLKKVKFWPKDRGLEMLGKYLAMFVERNRFEDKEGNSLPPVQVQFVGVEAQPIQSQSASVRF